MKTTLSVNFTKNNTNKKDETVLEFQVRGELSDTQIIALARLKAAGSVTLVIGSAQMELDDVYPEVPRGIRVTVHGDGTADVDGGQMTIEEAPPADDIDEEDKLPGLEDDDDDNGDPENDGEDEAESEDSDVDHGYPDDVELPEQEVEVAKANEDELPDF